ncbi:hypothetical protein JI58_08870, partial [Marinosulfonomonas sp. PRT-SC04]
LGLGLLVLKREAYFKDFVFGTKTSPGSYALVCPGVALSVMLHFFINKGLVAAGLIDKFDIAYWSLSGLAVAFQIAMIVLLLRLTNSTLANHAQPPPYQPSKHHDKNMLKRVA